MLRRGQEAEMSKRLADCMEHLDVPSLWDADLSLGEVKRLKPVDKGRRAKASLTRKIELLECWGRDGLPSKETSVPWDRAKLRRWRDPARRLWVWVDPQVDATRGRNGELIERFGLALQAIQAGRRDRGFNLKGQIEALKITIGALELQNIRLLDEVRQLQTKLAASMAKRS